MLKLIKLPKPRKCLITVSGWDESDTTLSVVCTCWPLSIGAAFFSIEQLLSSGMTENWQRDSLARMGWDYT